MILYLSLKGKRRIRTVNGKFRMKIDVDLLIVLSSLRGYVFGAEDGCLV